MSGTLETRTGDLYGRLWTAFDAAQYEDSVALFRKRFEASGFDIGWFDGKACLDAGCGGGRYSVAMARLGATVTACDVSASGLEDARRRMPGDVSIRFEQASVLELPYDDACFDFVCCSGVLHHTADFNRGLAEICRVLRPGGKCYILVYGAGSMRWEAVLLARPAAQLLGFAFLDRAVAQSGLPANNRRHFLDDLFVPYLSFRRWPELNRLLEINGMTGIDRWSGSQFDHEASPEAMGEDVGRLERIFEAAVVLAGDGTEIQCGLAAQGLLAVRDHRERIDWLIAQRDAGGIAAETCARLIIGEGNHRLVAIKAG